MRADQYAVPEAFRQAEAASQQGQFAESERLCRSILDSDPLHFEATRLLGLVQFRRGQCADALQTYEKALQIRSGDPDAHYERGIAFHWLKRFQEAEASFELAAVLRPGHPETHNWRGKSLKALARPEDALTSFDAALALRPDYPDAHYNRGAALQDLRRFADALASFDRALALRPDDVDTLCRRGAMLQSLGRHPDALACFDRVLAFRPDDPDGLHGRGVSLHAQKRFADAIAAYDTSLSVRPGHADTHRRRGDSLLALRRYDEALASHEKALTIDPGAVEPLFGRGLALQGLRRVGEAFACYDAVIAARPDHVDAHYYRGTVCQVLKRFEDALACYDRVLAMRPGHFEAMYSRGVVLQWLKRFKESLESYDRALAIRPDYFDIHLNRGHNLQLLRRLDEALADYDKALRLKPDHVEAQNQRANVLNGMRRGEEALAGYDRTLELKPDHFEAMFNRAITLQMLGRFEEALSGYDRTLAIRADQPEVHYRRANALRLLGRFDESIRSYDKALALKPDHADAASNRDAVLRERHRTEEPRAPMAVATVIAAAVPAVDRAEPIHSGTARAAGATVEAPVVEIVTPRPSGTAVLPREGAAAPNPAAPSAAPAAVVAMVATGAAQVRSAEPDAAGSGDAVLAGPEAPPESPRGKPEAVTKPHDPETDGAATLPNDPAAPEGTTTPAAETETGVTTKPDGVIAIVALAPATVTAAAPAGDGPSVGVSADAAADVRSPPLTAVVVVDIIVPKSAPEVAEATPAVPHGEAMQTAAASGADGTRASSVASQAQVIGFADARFARSEVARPAATAADVPAAAGVEDRRPKRDALGATVIEFTTRAPVAETTSARVEPGVSSTPAAAEADCPGDVPAVPDAAVAEPHDAIPDAGRGQAITPEASDTEAEVLGAEAQPTPATFVEVATPLPHPEARTGAHAVASTPAAVTSTTADSTHESSVLPNAPDVAVAERPAEVPDAGSAAAIEALREATAPEPGGDLMMSPGAGSAPAMAHVDGAADATVTTGTPSGVEIHALGAVTSAPSHPSGDAEPSMPDEGAAVHAAVADVTAEILRRDDPEAPAAAAADQDATRPDPVVMAIHQEDAPKQAAETGGRTEVSHHADPAAAALAGARHPAPEASMPSPTALALAESKSERAETEQIRTSADEADTPLAAITIALTALCAEIRSERSEPGSLIQVHAGDTPGPTVSAVAASGAEQSASVPDASDRDNARTPSEIGAGMLPTAALVATPLASSSPLPPTGLSAGARSGEAHGESEATGSTEAHGEPEAGGPAGSPRSAEFARPNVPASAPRIPGAGAPPAGPHKSGVPRTPALPVRRPLAPRPAAGPPAPAAPRSFPVRRPGTAIPPPRPAADQSRSDIGLPASRSAVPGRTPEAESTSSEIQDSLPRDDGTAAKSAPTPPGISPPSEGVPKTPPALGPAIPRRSDWLAAYAARLAALGVSAPAKPEPVRTAEDSPAAGSDATPLKPADPVDVQIRGDSAPARSPTAPVKPTPMKPAEGIDVSTAEADGSAPAAATPVEPAKPVDVRIPSRPVSAKPAARVDFRTREFTPPPRPYPAPARPPQRIDPRPREDFAAARPYSAPAKPPEPVDAAATIGKAVTAEVAGHFDEAERICRSIMVAEPDHPDALRLLARLARRRGGLREALGAWEKIVALHGEDPDAHRQLGIVLRDLGRHEDAAASFDRALAIDPDNAGVRADRAVALLRAGRAADALHSAEQALGIKPGDPDALCGKGAALAALDRLDEAVVSFNAALSLRPDLPDALMGRGNALLKLHRFEQALASFDAAAAAAPKNPEVHIARGLALRHLRRMPEALASFGTAQDLAPDDADAHWHEAATRLLTGDLFRGWSKYKWRSRRAGAAASGRPIAQPPWDGLSSLYGKTILLHADEDIGDAIQFCRYAQTAVARGARVILEVPQTLHGIMRSLTGVEQIVATGDPLPGFDTHCPLADLPMAFGTRLDSIPYGTSYLRAPTEALLAWEMRLGIRKRPRIGIVWAGDPGHEDDRERSAGLRAFLPLLRSGATFVRMQKELRPGEDELLHRHPDMLDVTEHLKDFSDAAALISRLDLVIAVDTSVAHLAGALGKPVWILLSHTPDWRWLLDRNNTPWYPTARLFRQTRPGDWDEVMERVAAELPAILNRDAAPPGPPRKPA